MINIDKLINKNKEMSRSEYPNILNGANNGDLAEISAAVEENPECINDTDKQTGVTALHLVSSDGNFSCVDYLCEQVGIDISIVDNFNRPAYLCAMQIGRQDIVDRIFKTVDENIARKEELEDTGANVSTLKPKPPTFP
ncbi:MAG: ankyrin repeat domain-containing protein [Hyphomicrobiales bacterium]